MGSSTYSFATFGPYRVDLSSGELRKHDRRVRIGEQPLQILLFLLERKGAIVTREELRARLWANATYVDFDHSLNSAVVRLRAALVDTADKPRWIETVPRHGYRFIGQIDRAEPETPVQIPKQASEASGQYQHQRVKVFLVSAGLVATLLLVFFLTMGWRGSPHLAHPMMLAVLPFANQTGSPADNYITDGLTDNLIRQLSEMPLLKVISRAAVDRTSPSALTALGVNTFLRGVLRRNGDGQLLLDSELSNAKDGTVLRSRRYLPDSSDLQSVQADIVQDVIQGLGMELDARQSADAKRPLTSSPAAFQSFLRGESAARDQNAQGLHTAISNYEDAIRQDAGFSLAYAALAESHTLLGLYFESPREHMPLARQYAERALALNPSLLQAHGMLGVIHLVYDWNYSAAQGELTAADARDAAFSALACTAHLLHTSGHIRHAEEDVHRGLEFDPLSPGLIAELGCVKYYAGRYDESVHYYREALTADTRSPVITWGLGRALGSEGHYSEALEVLRRFKTVNGFEPPIITAEIGYAEGASGDRKAALETAHMLQRASAQTYVDPYLVALIYLSLKDTGNTYAWLDKAYADRSPFLISLSTDPKWTASRQDARFQDLHDRMFQHASK
jgi:DNA-binding winged helix-turn-helix (wHTH) protein/TolB-like protein